MTTTEYNDFYRKCRDSGKDNDTCIQEWRVLHPNNGKSKNRKNGKSSKKNWGNKILETAGTIIAGFLTAGYFGNYLEEEFKPGVTKDSPMKDKVLAWIANNGPKVATAITLYKLTDNTIITNIRRGIEASFIVDSTLRYANNYGPTDKRLFGFHLLGNDAENKDVINKNDINKNVGKISALSNDTTSDKEWVPLAEEQIQEIDNKLKL